jgi:hypothetical protein
VAESMRLSVGCLYAFGWGGFLAFQDVANTAAKHQAHRLLRCRTFLFTGAIKPTKKDGVGGQSDSVCSNG